MNDPPPLLWLEALKIAGPSLATFGLGFFTAKYTRRRDDRRDRVARLRALVQEAQDKGAVYWSIDGADPARQFDLIAHAANLKLRLHELGGEITRFRAKYPRVPNELFNTLSNARTVFRQALTDGDFEVQGRPAELGRVARIAAAADALRTILDRIH